MNDELLTLYESDRHEHANQAKVNTPEYKAMRARDLQRRARVMEIVAQSEFLTAEDYFHAAWIMNHGHTLDDAQHAHTFALRSSKFGHRPARWLAAASYDRWLMYQGRTQKYGANYIFDGSQDRLWDVPPLAEQLRKAEEANCQRTPMSETERAEFEANAPGLFKKILEKWRAESNNDDGDSNR